jgi:LysM repeat protein
MKRRSLSLVVLVALLLAGFAVPHSAEAACNPVYHVVKPGQYLALIAASYGVTVQSIAQANNLWNPNVIYVGQVLLIPVSCVPQPSPTGCTGTYVVKAGDYLKKIAIRYHTTVTVLVNLNGIKNPNLIYPGQRLIVPIACPSPKPAPKPPAKPPAPAPSTGPWTCEYFSNRNLVGTPVFTKKVSLVNFNFGTGGPGGGIGGTNFSLRCTRTRTLENGSYLFYARADDGVRVWIDNVLVMDHFVDQPPTEYTVLRQLGAGDHKLRLEYYQHTGGALIRFFLQRYNGVNAWRGEYFNNMDLSGSPTFERYDPAIDFNFVNKPAPGVPLAHFSVRWTGEFSFTGGKYRFTATTDDGMRIYLDDDLILDQFHDQPPTTYRVDKDVSEGTHKLRVEYFQDVGTAIARVTWTQQQQ